MRGLCVRAVASRFSDCCANRFSRRKALKMKTNWTKVFAVMLASAALSLATFAQAPDSGAQKSAASTPSADKILDKYVAAIGGEAAWHKLSSRISKGTIEIPAMSLSGTVESHEKAPNSMLVVVNLGGAAFERGCDGTTAWADDPQNGLRTETGAEADDSKRQSDFYHQVNIRKYYSKWNVTGTEKIGDRDVYAVEATSLAGDMDKLYFDTQSGLLVRAITTVHTPQGALVIQSDLSDYRDADGIKLPFTVHQSSAQSDYTIKFTEVKHNLQLADSQFAKPAAEPVAAPEAKPPTQ
jgi:photosynthetic reaction center cytochrome c subunit